MQAEAVLEKYFGYKTFRGQQGHVIRHILSGNHALTIMPTGMGKSLCYQIPALMQDGLTVVISPLIALMKDQVDGLVARGIDAAYINSSLGRRQRQQHYADVQAGKYCLLYVTPERFRKQEFIDVIKSRKVNLLAVDEAHCISEWGHDFRPDYTRLEEFRERLGNPTTIALTATATPDVQQDIIRQLGLKPENVKLFHEGIDRPNLHLSVEDVWGEDEKLEHIVRLHQQHQGNGIVYFSLIKTLKSFSELLHKRKIRHLRYHGDLETEERKRVQNLFMQGENMVVLATNAFGMGIDKENIRFVIHAETPGSMEAYYQEIGRAGRDGKDSTCALLYDEQDLLIQMEFIKWSNPDAEFYERVYQLLTAAKDNINSHDLEWLKEQLHYKNTRDYRSETVLSMLDRYGVTEGRLEDKNLRLTSELPPQLQDQDYLDAKLERQQKKLYTLVQYTKWQGNPKAFIHDYFGLPFNGENNA